MSLLKDLHGIADAGERVVGVIEKVGEKFDQLSNKSFNPKNHPQAIGGPLGLPMGDKAREQQWTFAGKQQDLLAQYTERMSNLEQEVRLDLLKKQLDEKIERAKAEMLARLLPKVDKTDVPAPTKWTPGGPVGILGQDPHVGAVMLDAFGRPVNRGPVSLLNAFGSPVSFGPFGIRGSSNTSSGGSSGPAPRGHDEYWGMWDAIQYDSTSQNDQSNEWRRTHNAHSPTNYAQSSGNGGGDSGGGTVVSKSMKKTADNTDEMVGLLKDIKQNTANNGFGTNTRMRAGR